MFYLKKNGMGWLALVIISCCSAVSAETWKDAEGHEVTGEPTGMLGPFILIQNEFRSGQWVPLEKIPPELALRLDLPLRALPGRSDKWATARGKLTAPIIGSALRTHGERIEPVDLSAVPERELLLLLYVELGGPVWDAFDDLESEYSSLKERYGDLFEFVLVRTDQLGTSEQTVGHNGVRYSRVLSGDTQKKAVDTALPIAQRVPWLVVNQAPSISRTMAMMAKPDSSTGFMLATRHGFVIHREPGLSNRSLSQSCGQIEKLLELHSAHTPEIWRQKVGFYRNVRKAEFIDGQCAPLLVGSPLLESALTRFGIGQFEVYAKIDADGRVLDVDVPAGPEIEDKYREAIEKSFASVPVVPAVSNGQFVGGNLYYRYEQRRD